MRQSCTSRCRGLTPLRGSSGKRERWASRSGERGCRGARLPPGSWDAPWHLLRAPFPSSPPRVLSGAGAGAGSCAEVQPAGVDVRESRRRWGRHTHTHTPGPPYRWLARSLRPHMAGERRGATPARRPPRQSRGSPPFQKWPGGGASRGPRGLPPAEGGGRRTALPEGHRPQPRRRVGAGGARRDEPAWPPEAPPPPLLPQLPAALPSPLGSPVSLRTPPKSCRCPPSLCPRRLPAPGPGPGPGRAGGGGARLEKGREGSSHWRTRTRCLLDDAPLQ